jgi:hypothetical protein
MIIAPQHKKEILMFDAKKAKENNVRKKTKGEHW